MRPNFDEIAKITRDLNYAYLAGYKRLIGKDDILALKGGGDLKLYETVAQDDQVKSCVQQRISAVISRDWGVEPGDDSKPAQQAAEFIEAELKNLQWDRINEKMLWGAFYGYSVGEIMWRRGDKIGIDDIKVRNRRRFNFGTDLLPKLITIEDPLGEDLPDQKFWHFCCGGDNDDDPYGRGLAHWLYWPTFFKRADMRWWVTFLEKYAQPTRLGKYSPGASETDKDTLWQAMDAFGTNGKMMIPEGTMIELLEAARAGGADYQGMLDICNAAISKIVLSQTMTTDNGSSQSQANVHQDVKDDIVKADADLICSSFNQGPIKWLTDWNFPGVAYPRVWRQMDAAVDLTAEADRDTKLQALGISLKPESIAAKYGDDYLVPDNKEQIPQLNSEQVNALVSIVSNAKQGGWSPELVAGMINGAFPNWPDEAVAAITDNLGESKAKEPVKPNQPVDLNAVSAQFSVFDGTVEFKMKEGTTKEKNGVTYLLSNSRWKRAEPKAKATTKSTKKPLSEKAKKIVEGLKNRELKPGFVGEIDPKLIQADPKRFQYKLVGEHTKTGEVGSLSGVGTYDPNLAGIVSVWIDPNDKKPYIINGHNRLALANRADAPKIAVRVIDAADAKTARSIGALTNIAEGRGTALDAAKFFKDTGIDANDLKAKGIPMREKIATDGIAISQLEPTLFAKVIDGELSENRASLIGKAKLDPTQQRDLYKMTLAKSKGGKIIDEVLSELIDNVKASEVKQVSILDLFGTSTESQSNAIARATLTAGIKRQLGRDKKLFGLVAKSKAAEELTRAGNVIDREASGKVSSDADAALRVFDSLKNQSGAISSAINSHAADVANGTNQTTAQKSLYAKVADIIKSGKY